jgi:hypothetical protein
MVTNFLPAKRLLASEELCSTELNESKEQKWVGHVASVVKREESWDTSKEKTTSEHIHKDGIKRIADSRLCIGKKFEKKVI